MAHYRASNRFWVAKRETERGVEHMQGYLFDHFHSHGHN